MWREERRSASDSKVVRGKYVVKAANVATVGLSRRRCRSLELVRDRNERDPLLSQPP